MANNSPLLHLPAELRNTICEFALTAPPSLHYCKPKDGGKPYLYLRPDSQQQTHVELAAPEYNTLKYVCKQLYTETAGLKLKFNDVVLECSSSAKPAEDLIGWLSSICDAKKAWIRTIIIQWEASPSYDTISEHPNAIVRLTRLCKQNASMTVKYHIPTWRLHHDQGSARNFFYRRRSLTFALRGVDLEEQFVKLWIRAEKLEHLPLPTRYGMLWRREHPIEDLQAKNLTYYPTLNGDVENCVIREDMMVVADGTGVQKVKKWIGTEVWKRWIKHGI
jgi:hypothetical protein